MPAQVCSMDLVLFLLGMEETTRTMKANLILPFCMMFLCVESFAQDIIHTVDLRSIEANVLEITDDYVRYKTFDNLEGPDYRMSVSRIIRIVFENGTEKVFTQTSPFASSYYSYSRDFSPISYRRGYYYDRYGRIGVDRMDELGIALYGSDYRKAKMKTYWGMSLTVLGSAMVISSIVGSAMIRDYNRSEPHWGGHWDEHSGVSNDIEVFFGIAGAGCLGAGIPLWISGNRKLNKIADDYNKQYRSNNGYGYAPSVELRSGGNGIGLALRF